MYTTSFAKLADKKEKAGKASLRWLFSGADETVVQRISDKRDAGVYSKNQNMMAGPGGNQDKNKGDSLPGFLTLDLFTGGLLSLAFHGVNIAPMAEAADGIWLDRRPASQARPAEASYFLY